MNPFHITRLEIDGFKRIVATAISPQDGKPILLTGDNGQGKSSILDSILWAFTNSGVGKPIREGNKQAVVGVEIKDGSRTLQIKRRAKGDNHYLDVTDMDGGKVEKPQAFLNSLIGNLAFDPEAFARLKDKEQADQLRQATGLDTAELDEEIREKYTLRAAANKDSTAAEAAFKGCPVVSSTDEREPQSAAGLVTELQNLRTELTAAEDARGYAETTSGIVADCEKEIEELTKKLNEAIGEKNTQAKTLAKQKEQAATLEAAAAGHSQRISEITAQLGQIDQTNAEITRHNEAVRLRKSRHATFVAAHEKATKLDVELEGLRTKRANLIAATTMPVEGLAIEEDVVVLNGIPLRDLNTAKRIEVATRIAIAQNPNLGVIFVREGALINDANLQVIAEVAREAGMQLWIEKFQPDAGSSGLHIVEGLVALVDGKQPAPEQPVLIA